MVELTRDQLEVALHFGGIERLHERGSLKAPPGACIYCSPLSPASQREYESMQISGSLHINKPTDCPVFGLFLLIAFSTGLLSLSLTSIELEKCVKTAALASRRALISQKILLLFTRRKVPCEQLLT